ncbi:DnaD domain-containing protein [Paenibacillaceae bacterium T2]|uniref:DnaD domain-containing protein n=2 Tax=Ferviditalea candida TaxID=3108399 RepID=A0ABU5ZJQ2_9BACL|nr:DnaD domain-containing protein [Paenibacillaceae bacterium T2]
MMLAMREGTVSVPHMLLKHYRKLRLSELEVMLIIHLLAFKEKEQKDFPTIEEIQSRMTASGEQVIQTLERLLKEHWLEIDEETEADTGIRYERYNLTGVYRKLAAAEETMRSLQVSGANSGRSEALGGAGYTISKDKGRNMFTIFEREFARPLSPMECETISGWLDQDKYAEELILAALKEAVFAGKLHFRYIDRILLEWSRNRVFNAEQAKAFTQKFRGER